MLSSRALLLTGHILGAVLFIGPLTVAASAFPGYAQKASDDEAARGAALAMHRVSRAYGTSTLIVPTLGFVLAGQSGSFGQTWLTVAIVVHAVGVVLLFAQVMPLQRTAAAMVTAREVVPPAQIGRLHSMTGFYAVTWVITLALMVIKPSW